MAVTKKSVKVKDTEDLSDTNIEKVIALLSAEKPCTKKDACTILKIAYNTTRLQTIIDNFLAKKAKTAEMRATKSGTPPTQAEIEYCVQSYLAGDPVSTIAEALYRASSFVDKILVKTGTPKRSVGWSYFEPNLIPEEATKESFEVSEKVWSARYESLATVLSEVKNQPHTSKVYKVYLEDEKWQQYAYQPAEELASLGHLTQYGIKNK